MKYKPPFFAAYTLFVEYSNHAQPFCIGGITDLSYMGKQFGEAMGKRGFTNTDIRNKQSRQALPLSKGAMIVI